MGMKLWDSKFLDEAIAGDRRYDYVPFSDLSHKDQHKVKEGNYYPHRSWGAKYYFIPEHYFYPIKKDQTLAEARRVLAIPFKLIQNDNYMKSLGYKVSEEWEKKIKKVAMRWLQRV